MSDSTASADVLPVQRALILAAGRGSRLGSHTRSLPKPLMSLGNTTILGRQLGQLEAHGVRSVTIVTGYRSERIRSATARRKGDLTVSLVRNAEWEDSGSAWSLVQAASVLRGGEPILLLHGDVVFDDAILARVLARGGTNVAIDRAWRSLTGDEVLAWTRNGAVAGVRKGRPDDDADEVGEFVGVSLFSPSFAWAFVDACVARTAVDRRLDYEQPLLHEFVARSREACRAVFSEPHFWRNVNDADDLLAARRHVTRPTRTAGGERA